MHTSSAAHKAVTEQSLNNEQNNLDPLKGHIGDPMSARDHMPISLPLVSSPLYTSAFTLQACLWSLCLTPLSYVLAPLLLDLWMHPFLISLTPGESHMATLFWLWSCCLPLLQILSFPLCPGLLLLSALSLVLLTRLLLTWGSCLCFPVTRCWFLSRPIPIREKAAGFCLASFGDSPFSYTNIFSKVHLASEIMDKCR